MGDTFNFNGSIGQFVKEGDGIIHDYHAQSMAASSSVQNTSSASSSELAESEGANAGQLSNRQVVIMMAGLLDVSLSPDFTNQKQLAQFLSRLTGRSKESIRQTASRHLRQERTPSLPPTCWSQCAREWLAG